MNAILQIISDIFGLEMWFGLKTSLKCGAFTLFDPNKTEILIKTTKGTLLGATNSDVWCLFEWSYWGIRKGL